MGDSEGLVLAIVSKADSTTQKRRTMKLLGKIGKEQILILVDSGSVGTFVSTTLVHKLDLSTTTYPNSSYKSASGGTMLCNSMVLQISCHGLSRATPLFLTPKS